MQESPEITTSLQARVKRELTHALYPNLLTTVPHLATVALILVIKLRGHVNFPALLAWFAVFLTFTACQAALVLWFNRTREEHSTHLQFRLLVADVMMIGMLWGAAGYMFMPTDTIGQSYVILIMAFVAAGGPIFLSGSWLASSLYASAVLIPVLVSLGISFYSQAHHEVYFNIGVALTSYWGFLMALGYYGSKIISENYQHGMVNEVLKRDNEELEKLNIIACHEKEKHLSPTEDLGLSHAEFQKKDAVTDCDTQEVMEIRYMQSRAYARRHQQSLAIFSIDLSNYDEVSVKLGKDFASLLLKTVAVRLEYCKRETDILARVEDGKFILVVTELRLGTEMITVLNKIMKIFAEKTIINESNFQIEAGIGISLFPKDGQDIQELIQKSDEALAYLYFQGKTEKLGHQIYDAELMTTGQTATNTFQALP